MEAQTPSPNPQSGNKRILGLLPPVFFIMLTLVVVIVVGTLGIVGWNLVQNYQKAKQNEILLAIANANPAGMTGRGQKMENESATLMTGLATDSAKLASGVAYDMYPGVENSYSYQKIAISYGPAIDSLKSCSAYNLEEGYSESFSHYTSDLSFSHYVTYDVHGVISSEYFNTNDYSQEYQGGSFAIKILNNRAWLLKAAEAADESYVLTDKGTPGTETVQSGGVSSDVSSDNTDIITKPASSISNTTDLKAYYGDDVQVVGEESVNGDKYYVISWSYEDYCQDESRMKVYIKSWINGETYAVYKSEYYRSEIKPENLMYTETVDSETKTVDFDEVADNFSFFSKAEVKTMDLESVYDQINAKYVDGISSYITSQGFGFVAPANYSSVDYVSAPDVTQDYSLISKTMLEYYTRDFWPATAAGQKSYEDFTGMYNNSSIAVPEAAAPGTPEGYYTSRFIIDYFLDDEGSKSVYVNMYDQVDDLDSFLSEQYGINDFNSEKQYTIKLDGQEVTVREGVLYISTENEIAGDTAVSSSSPAMACQEGQTCPGSDYRVFSLNGHTYVIEQYGSFNGSEFNSADLAYYKQGTTGYNKIVAGVKSTLGK